MVPKVQVVCPVRLSPLSLATSAIACWKDPRSGALSASRSLPRPRSRPCSSTTRYVGRRCSGTLSQSQASRGTTRPVRARHQRSRASSSGSSPAGTSARNSRARFGAGTRLTRRFFGRLRISGGDQLLAQPRHVPGEVGGRDPVEHRDRDLDGEAVVVGAGLEVVADREGQAGPDVGAPLLGVVLGAHLLHGVVGEHRRVEGQQVRLAAPRLLPPLVEVGAADHLGAHPGVVEVEEGVLVDHEVAAPGPVLELLGLLQQPLVLGEEAVPAVPLPVHQRVADEQLARERRVDLAVADQPVGHERYAVQRRALVGHHRGPLLAPVRLRPGPLDQVAAEALGPLGLDAGDLARPQPPGLDELAGHHELRGSCGPPRCPGRSRTARRGRRGTPADRGDARRAALAALARGGLVALLEQPDLARAGRTAAPGGSRRRRGRRRAGRRGRPSPCTPGAAGTRSPATRAPAGS